MARRTPPIATNPGAHCLRQRRRSPRTRPRRRAPLAWPDLVDLVTGRGGDPRAARAQVRHDETRLFHVAVTRARHRLVVTAIRSEDEQPSPFLDVVDPLPDARPFTDVPRPLTLQGLVADLRRALGSDDPALRGAAVSALAGWRARECPAPTRPSGGPCATSPTTAPAVAPPTRCGCRPRASTASGAAGCSGCCGPAAATGRRWGPRTSASSCTRSPTTLGDTTAAAYAAEVERRWGRLARPRLAVAPPPRRGPADDRPARHLRGRASSLAQGRRAAGLYPRRRGADEGRRRSARATSRIPSPPPPWA